MLHCYNCESFQLINVLYFFGDYTHICIIIKLYEKQRSNLNTAIYLYIVTFGVHVALIVLTEENRICCCQKAALNTFHILANSLFECSMQS